MCLCDLTPLLFPLSTCRSWDVNTPKAPRRGGKTMMQLQEIYNLKKAMLLKTVFEQVLSAVSLLHVIWLCTFLSSPADFFYSYFNVSSLWLITQHSSFPLAVSTYIVPVTHDLLKLSEKPWSRSEPDWSVMYIFLVLVAQKELGSFYPFVCMYVRLFYIHMAELFCSVWGPRGPTPYLIAKTYSMLILNIMLC